MIQEIYIRPPNDPNYRLDVLSYSDPIESILSKIKVIFGTRQGQTMGDLNFGVGLEDLIFETRINKTQLEEQIKKQIDQYIYESKDYKIHPKVSFGKADGYDFCVIDVLINNEKVLGIIVK